jgi:hypothetical protein
MLFFHAQRENLPLMLRAVAEQHEPRHPRWAASRHIYGYLRISATNQCFGALREASVPAIAASGARRPAPAYYGIYVHSFGPYYSN